LTSPFRPPDGKQQSLKWADREGEKGTTVEVVANLMRILDRAPNNGSGAKPAESPKAEEPVDASDNPFNEAREESAERDIPF
jgi:single-stranded DNA-binding protein